MKRIRPFLDWLQFNWMVIALGACFLLLVALVVL